jgi:hypothetical protein
MDSEPDSLHKGREVQISQKRTMDPANWERSGMSGMSGMNCKDSPEGSILLSRAQVHLEPSRWARQEAEGTDESQERNKEGTIR